MGTRSNSDLRFRRVRDVVFVVAMLLVGAHAGLPLVSALAESSEAPAAIPLAVPLATTFTYQGRLAQANASASGPFDFQFLLFDSPAGATQVGSIITTPGVAVSSGLFAVQLNFGAAAFTGDARWLEVRVKAPGAQAYDTVGRQELTATPYALYARAAAVATTATSAQTVPWSGIANVPVDIADGDQVGPIYMAQSPVALIGNAFGFSTVGCTAGELWKYSGAGNTWSCEPDAGGTTYTAGSGLLLSGTQFAVNFHGTGSASSVSHSDHDHFGQAWSGTSGTAGLSITNVNGSGLQANSGPGDGIVGTSTTAIGVRGTTGTGLAGIYGETSNANSNAIFGRSFAPDGNAITGISDDPNSTNDGVGVVGSSGGAPKAAFGPTGVSGSGYGSAAKGVNGYGLGSSSTGVYGTAEGVSSRGVMGYGHTTGVAGVGGEFGVTGQGGTAGVVGLSDAGNGVRASSSQNYAVYATTTDGFAAVWGRARVAGSGLENVGTADTGVYGQSFASNGSGVLARNESSGAGITAYSISGLAGQFLGPITVGSCTGCANVSDARLKRDISASAYGLDAIAQLLPVEFAYINDVYGPGPHLGFLAQDVQQVIPELVTENADDGYLRLDYDGIIPVLVKGMQEQQAQIDALKAATGSHPMTGEEVSSASVSASSKPSMLVFAALALAAMALAVACSAVVSSRRE
ncbi:hypothetical protein AYO38_09225 [bacterium SCGC AG-212-C10]|nr:hypothetical protein AYO38_09225 [bacterium SCGC AG-212-C10]